MDSVLYPEKLNAVSCSILAIYPSKLCGDAPRDTQLTFSAVWCELFNRQTYPYFDIDGKTFYKSWAQVGIIVYRQSSYQESSPFEYEDTDTSIGYYYETKGYRRNVAIFSGPLEINGEMVYPPAQNSINHFSISRIIEPTNAFFYRYNGHLIYVDICAEEEDDPIWYNKYASYMQWAGEIEGLQTDLFGTDSDKCEISACSYRNIFDTMLIGTQATQLGVASSSNSNEWGVEIVNDSTINIWDKLPR